MMLKFFFTMAILLVSTVVSQEQGRNLRFNDKNIEGRELGVTGSKQYKYQKGKWKWKLSRGAYVSWDSTDLMWCVEGFDSTFPDYLYNWGSIVFSSSPRRLKEDGKKRTKSCTERSDIGDGNCQRHDSVADAYITYKC